MLNKENIALLGDYARIIDQLEASKNNKNSQAIAIINARIDKLGKFADDFTLNPSVKNKNKLVELIEGVALRLEREKTNEQAAVESAPLTQVNRDLKNTTVTLGKELNFAIGKLMDLRKNKPAQTEKLWTVANQWSRELTYIDNLIAKGDKQDEPNIQRHLTELFKQMQERLQVEKKSPGLGLFKSEVSGISSRLYNAVKRQQQQFQEKFTPEAPTKKL